LNWQNKTSSFFHFLQKEDKKKQGERTKGTLSRY
jgi:hypothetical protein